MTKMADVRQENIVLPDERAAGVISGADPYRELELYLEKVSEEFGEVFERWLGGTDSKQVSTLPRSHGSSITRIPPHQIPPVPPVRKKRSALLVNGSNKPLPSRAHTKQASAVEWSDSAMQDFDLLIKHEIYRLEQEANEVRSKQQLVQRSISNEEKETAKEPPKSPDGIKLFPVNPEEPGRRRSSDPEIPPRKSTRLPSPEKIKAFFGGIRSTSPFRRNKKAEKQTKKEEDTREEIPLGVQTLLSQLRPRMPPATSPSSEGQPSSGFGTMDSSDLDSGLDSILVNTATQTSPTMSRSSSFTWLSDCSSLALNISDANECNDEKSTTSSSPSTSPTRTPCTNGCGADCYCPNYDSMDSSPESSRAQRVFPVARGTKCNRKETWERIRRRNSDLLRVGRSLKDTLADVDVWVRRESVHTQTVEDTPDLPQTADEDDDELEDEMGVRVSGRPPLPRGGGSLPRPQHLTLVSSSANVSPSQLPSPSSASLKLVLTTPLPPDLCSKSSSAPMIMKKPAAVEQNKEPLVKQPRSHSERHLAEIEAADACKWLRAAGFPQYAQMFENLQFPIDVSAVQKDHPFLDKDSLQSLFRRLQALNRCAKMKIENSPKTVTDDSDEEDQCALSENWTFQPESRRWSRVCEVTAQHLERLQTSAGADDHTPGERLPDKVRYGSLPPASLAADSELLAARFRRTGSERLRDGAKAILRRMESIKTRHRKKIHREVVISEPQIVDFASMQQKVEELQCVDVSPSGSPPPFGDDSSSYCSDNSGGTPARSRAKISRAKRFFNGPRREEALSDSEVHPSSWRQRYFKDANSNHTKLDLCEGGSRRHTDEDSHDDTPHPAASRSLPRGGSLNLGAESQRYREKVQNSFRRKDYVYHDKSGSSELTEDSSSTIASQPDSDLEVSPRHKATVVRWHSFQRGRPESYHPWREVGTCARAMSALSSGQLMVLRKLALLKLTACMERYCPTHRTGWNWELPKFIRKIKAPDYKDKSVFGVPLLLSLQRSGQSLPNCIQTALRWLRSNAMDQVGLFRKSGVRSRIQTLKVLTEDQGENVCYDGHQAYDLADMVKQYFRELPEAIVTNKLSETFISIFQHVPLPFQRDAVQWAILLLPDEHREALQTVLEFLHQVSMRCCSNQMTASNLAVCLAPSLFHLHHPTSSPQSRSSSTSPRRRKTVGVPDQKELGENKAAHDCLLYLIKEHREAFVVSEEMFTSCRFNTLEVSVPMTLDELGAELTDGWRAFLRESTQAFLKEVREKSRGWVSATGVIDSQTDVAYKKVGDGHPLRLWRVATEVEAPPQEVLRRVLRERHVWDPSLLKWRVVQRLDTQSEVFQYVCASMSPLPAKDYCVLRSWRGDLAKGACVIVETSVEHEDAAVMSGGVRGVVLASRYLIEPCGSGKSRIVHLSRVDTKGRSPDWYNKSYGHICAMQLSKIRNSFRHTADGPESKV